MAVGYWINGKYVKCAGNYSSGATEEATEDKPGLMSPLDKRKLDNALTTDDDLTEEQINSLF